MKHSFASSVKRFWHSAMRRAFSFFPRSLRFAVYRSFVDCDAKPDARLTFQIATSRDDLEACFRLLHDAYVSSGFMKPDPSGMRATIYHALPSTTTLCAKYDGQVVGTLSLIRESALGFPLQAVFDLQEIRERGGQIAEVSALAIHPKFRKTGGSILFPLMKFMYEYCITYFDTRHLVIAVNPDRIEMYESLLLFQRLEQSEVDNYDFANGAPAVGASLDLGTFSANMKKVYRNKPPKKNLHIYFDKTRLKNFVLPSRRYYTTNDPVMTPDLLDYFFNRKTTSFTKLDGRSRHLLHTIYDTEPYQGVLPPDTEASAQTVRERQHQRYSLKCPGSFSFSDQDKQITASLRVVELSDSGFLAYSKQALPMNNWGDALIQLGADEKSSVRAMAVRAKNRGAAGFYGFKLAESDLAWQKFVAVLEAGATQEDMSHATQFLSD